MTRALALHHDANSTLGLVGGALRDRGVEIIEHTICADLGSPRSSGPLPTLDGIDALVLTGSRWSVYDDDHIGGWIHDEIELIRDADRRDIAVIGLCFGGQVLAAALGGTVVPSPTPEIGWFEIETDVPEHLTAGPWFEWHFDRFDPPPGATILARTCHAAQAFRLRGHLGLQFHPELDSELLDLWLADDADQLESAGLDIATLVADTALRSPDARPHTESLVSWWLGGMV